jgi:hypothetical protein
VTIDVGTLRGVIGASDSGCCEPLKAKPAEEYALADDKTDRRHKGTGYEPGTLMRARSGAAYLVQKDGSWRRLKPGTRLRAKDGSPCVLQADGTVKVVGPPPEPVLPPLVKP